MNKPTTNPAQTVTLIAALVILAVFGASYLITIPQLIQARTSLATAKAQSAGLDIDQQTLASAQQNLIAAQQQLAQKGVNFAAFPSLYPPTEDVPGLYIQLEALIAKAKQSGIIANYTLSTPVLDPDQTGRIPLSFTATGTFQQLQDFMTTLEFNSRPILINSLSISPAVTTDPTKGTPAAAFTLSAAAYTKIGALSGAYAVASK